MEEEGWAVLSLSMMHDMEGERLARMFRQSHVIKEPEVALMGGRPFVHAYEVQPPSPRVEPEGTVIPDVVCGSSAGDESDTAEESIEQTKHWGSRDGWPRLLPFRAVRDEEESESEGEWDEEVVEEKTNCIASTVCSLAHCGRRACELSYSYSVVEVVALQSHAVAGGKWVMDRCAPRLWQRSCHELVMYGQRGDGSFAAVSKETAREVVTAEAREEERRVEQVRLQPDAASRLVRGPRLVGGEVFWHDARLRRPAGDSGSSKSLKLCSGIRKPNCQIRRTPARVRGGGSRTRRSQSPRNVKVTCRCGDAPGEGVRFFMFVHGGQRGRGSTAAGEGSLDSEFDTCGSIIVLNRGRMDTARAELFNRTLKDMDSAFVPVQAFTGEATDARRIDVLPGQILAVRYQVPFRVVQREGTGLWLTWTMHRHQVAGRPRDRGSCSKCGSSQRPVRCVLQRKPIRGMQSEFKRVMESAESARKRTVAMVTKGHSQAAVLGGNVEANRNSAMNAALRRPGRLSGTDLYRGDGVYRFAPNEPNELRGPLVLVRPRSPTDE